MAIDSHYVLGAPLEEFFIDKTTALPLAAGTITFYKDSSRITAKTVYELSGSPPNYTFTALPNPMTLSSVGTPQNAGGDNVAIYYYPYNSDPDSESFGDIELYYVVVRDSDGVEQFTREAWPASSFTSGGSDTANNAVPVQNQISNPQFTRVFINEGDAASTQDSEQITYSASGGTNYFEFAPNWVFETGGSGTVKVTRIALQGNAAPTNPPYAINIETSGLSYCYLRQRFYGNPALWASTDDNDIFLSSMLVIRNNLTAAAAIQMYHHESSGNDPFLIFDESVSGSGFVQYASGSETAVPASTNTSKGNNAWTDIYITFPSPCDVDVTSVQVVPSFNATSAAIVAYDEVSANRDQALLGDYYIPRLEAKPIDSLLTGWDFPLNPAQTGTDFTVSSPQYTWDQTIIGKATGNVTVSYNAITYGITAVQTASNNDAFYMMQYLNGNDVKKILGTRLSVNVNAYTSVAAAGTITMRVYLYRGKSAATFGTGTASTGVVGTPLGTVATSGVFTQTDTTNWVLIPRSGLDTATATLNEIATNDDINNGNDYGFNGWEIIDAAQIADTDKFAIVVTFHNDVASMVNVTSISLVPGDIPTRPAVLSSAQTLARCQYYYEKSYDAGVSPAASSTNGVLRFQCSAAYQTGGNIESNLRSFGFQYNTPKRVASTVVLYAVNGNVNALSVTTLRPTNLNSRANLATDGLNAAYAIEDSGCRGVSYRTVSTVANTSASAGTYGALGPLWESYITFHYTADCRLGIV
jgi:hypothetical protein